MIHYVAADEGGLIFTIECEVEGEIKRRADTIEDGVHWVDQYGIAVNELFFSSSMDFAAEYYFENDMGAKDMFNSITAQSKTYTDLICN